VYDAIPPHCFNRNTVRSLSYVARDLLLVVLLGLSASYIQYVPYLSLRILAWSVYGFCQGLAFTGLWVLAHECGHGAFSASKTVCDTVGWLLHSSLLVPYFSWKFSHSEHHKHTGHLEADTVFVPATATDRANKLRNFPELDGADSVEHSSLFYEMMAETPLWTAMEVVGQQLLGWPLYLLANVTGHKYQAPRWKLNHFLPSAPLFEKKQANAIFMSDVGFAIAAFVITVAVKSFGFSNVALCYLVPYLWCNHWLVLVTYLQHTDPALPHYRAATWTFTRGALATMDRDFGFIGRHVFHRIIETHVAHHLCSRIPFYHAEEATVGIKKVLKEHYKYDGTNIFVALWRSCRSCQWVPDSGDVVFFKNANGLLKAQGESKKKD